MPALTTRPEATIPNAPPERTKTLHIVETRDFTDEPEEYITPSRVGTGARRLFSAPFPGTRQPSLDSQGRDAVPAYAPPVKALTEGGQPRKWTQEDQDEEDNKSRKRAMADLMQGWQDRLQWISIITTFFAATEAQLLGTTTPEDVLQRNKKSVIMQIANGALAGALVVHVFAAILSFLAAFFLIRYKLTIAKRDERKAESGFDPGRPLNAGLPPPATSSAPAATTSAPPLAGSKPAPAPGVYSPSSSSSSGAGVLGPGIFSSNPHIETVGPFRRGTPPTGLLDHCHSVCMWLSAVGFAMALAGVVCFAWSRLPWTSAAFASACTAVCLCCGVGAVFWPSSPAHHW